MITSRAHSDLSTVTRFPWTPESSPRLVPALADGDAGHEAKMSAEDLSATRPVTISGPPPESAPSLTWPTLEDILSERSRPPYTLSAFTAYLSQQHCLETLEFTMDAKQYQTRRARMATDSPDATLSHAQSEVLQLQQDWTRLLDVYVKPGSPREINLPAEERDDLLDQEYSERPPEPEVLDAAVHRINDLMADSIFLPFLNSYGSQTQPQNCCGGGRGGGGGCGGPDRSQVSKSMYEDRVTRLDRLDQNLSRRRPSQPSSMSIDFSTFHSPRSSLPRHGQPSEFTSGLSRASASGLSTHVSNSSAASGPGSSLTDDSGSGHSLGAGLTDPMTPPTTPPSSDLLINSSPGRHSPRPNRSDGGNWRKMGIKFWGRKKTQGTSRERPS